MRRWPEHGAGRRVTHLLGALAHRPRPRACCRYAVLIPPPAVGVLLGQHAGRWRCDSRGSSAWPSSTSASRFCEHVGRRSPEGNPSLNQLRSSVGVGGVVGAAGSPRQQERRCPRDRAADERRPAPTAGSAARPRSALIAPHAQGSRPVDRAREPRAARPPPLIALESLAGDRARLPVDRAAHALRRRGARIRSRLGAGCRSGNGDGLEFARNGGRWSHPEIRTRRCGRCVCARTYSHGPADPSIPADRRPSGRGTSATTTVPRVLGAVAAARLDPVPLGVLVPRGSTRSGGLFASPATRARRTAGCVRRARRAA